MEAIAITALFYTIMQADDERVIIVLSPDAVITLASPAAYRENFCVNIFNSNLVSAIRIRGLPPAYFMTHFPTPLDMIAANEVQVYPQQKMPITLKNGMWSVSDKCPADS